MCLEFGVLLLFRSLSCLHKDNMCINRSDCQATPQQLVVTAKVESGEIEVRVNGCDRREG